jgi:hypothetical protein
MTGKNNRMLIGVEFDEEVLDIDLTEAGDFNIDDITDNGGSEFLEALDRLELSLDNETDSIDWERINILKDSGLEVVATVSENDLWITGHSKD